LVQHGHVLINGKRVDIPSYQVKVNDIVEIKEDFKNNAILEDATKLSKAVGSVPQWVEVDYEKRNGKIIRLPERKDIEPIFNEQAVVELYSK
ncbi:MAG TPA: S4 domain-containing protein, partial [Spirochaetota bacterium]|nr:S4 domain-containing protein [Spirochaetota bacterium]